MKFGCVTTIADYPLMQKAGFDYVELSGRNVCAMNQAAFYELQRMIQTEGLPCLGFNAYCPPDVRIAGPGFSQKAAREYAKRCLSRAVELNIHVVGVGSPMSRNLPEGYDRNLAMHQAEEFFAVTAEVFAAQNIYVCVEALGPCYCNFINSLAEAQGIVRAVNRKNLKLVLDFYNMEHSGEAELPLFPFINDIVHAHISDDAGSPQKRWFLRPEKRDLHTARLKRLRDAGYLGAVTLEIDLPVDLDQARQSLKILKDSVF
jgi:sugar phosphate isomerase/epimerase